MLFTLKNWPKLDKRPFYAKNTFETVFLVWYNLDRENKYWGYEVVHLNITDVRVKKFNGQNRLKAIAAITIDECFVVHELRIIDGKAGLFVAMPSRKMPNGEFKDVAHPINQETRNNIEVAVIEAYNLLPEE